MPKATMVVWTNPAEGADEAEFNRWYDEVHVRDVLKLDGFLSCTRYKVADAQFGPADTPGRYVAHYEVEVDDLAQIPKVMGEAFMAGELPMREDLLVPGPILIAEQVSPTQTA
jgi:hypothetical protein